MKKKNLKIAVAVVTCACTILPLLCGCTETGTTGSSKKEVYVYNWGEYIDPDVLDSFTEETGIKVIYDEYETNEIMYPKVEAGAVTYDVLCPSDYMIQKMIENDLLAELNYANIPNIK